MKDELNPTSSKCTLAGFSSSPFLLWFREPSLTSGFVADIDADVLCARLARGLNRLSIVKIEAFEATNDDVLCKEN